MPVAAREIFVVDGQPAVVAQIIVYGRCGGIVLLMVSVRGVDPESAFLACLEYGICRHQSVVDIQVSFATEWGELAGSVPITSSAPETALSAP